MYWSPTTKSLFKAHSRWLGNLTFQYVLTVAKWWPGSGISATRAKFSTGKGCELIHFWQEETPRSAWKQWKQFRSRVDQHPTYPHSHSTQTLLLMRWYPEPVGLCLFFASLSLNPDNLSASTVYCDHPMHWEIFLSFAPQASPKSLAVLYSYTRRWSLIYSALPAAAAQLSSSCFVSSEALLTLSVLSWKVLCIFLEVGDQHTPCSRCAGGGYSSNQKKYSDLSSWLIKERFNFILRAAPWYMGINRLKDPNSACGRVRPQGLKSSLHWHSKQTIKLHHLFPKHSSSWPPCSTFSHTANIQLRIKLTGCNNNLQSTMTAT